MIPPSASSLLALSAVVSTAWAATDPVLEPKNFDVADALLDLGVGVNEIPALAEDSKRSTAGCAAAVRVNSTTMPALSNFNSANHSNSSMAMRL